jgi:Animal haem peroxidase
MGAFNLDALRLTLREKNLYHPTIDGQQGALASGPPPPECLMFRLADGQFNDLRYPMMGAAQTRFGRNFPLEEVHPECETNLLQPSPRVVSQRLLARTDFKPASTLNLLAAAWIQFQIHDWFSHGDNETDLRFAIPLSPDDPWHERPMKIKRTRCDSTRSDEDELAGLPPTFINMTSHWWDASAIYGSDPDTTSSLRLLEGGKLQMENRRLPVKGSTKIASTGFSTNWWIGLELLHTVFALEHNAICDRLQLEFPNWGDEELFQTARLVNAALMAKIHTVEWTPAILGHQTLQFGMRANWWGLAGEQVTKLFGRFGTGELVSGIPGSPQDHQDVPFSLTEEFVSVYRMHSLLPDKIQFRRLATGEIVKDLKMEEVLREKAHGVIDEDLTIFDVLYSFGITHPGALILHNFPDFLCRLELPPDASGEREIVDLGAIDVLRDRERGVPRYNRFRRLLRLKPATSFEELTDNAEWARELREIYKDDVERVDLLVGTLAETPPKGFGISETAFRIFLLMATRRIKSDRFFTDDYTPRVYSQIGLDWIGKNDMTSVLLRHYPELKPTLWRTRNAFAPWRSLH